MYYDFIDKNENKIFVQAIDAQFEGICRENSNNDLNEIEYNIDGIYINTDDDNINNKNAIKFSENLNVKLVQPWFSSHEEDQKTINESTVGSSDSGSENECKIND